PSVKKKRRAEQELRVMLSRRFDVGVPPNLFFVHRYASDSLLLRELERTPGRLSWRNLALALAVVATLIAAVSCGALYPHSDVILGSAICLACIILPIVGVVIFFNSETTRQNDQQIKLIFGEIIACKLVHEYTGSASESGLEVEFKFSTKKGT